MQRSVIENVHLTEHTTLPGPPVQASVLVRHPCIDPLRLHHHRGWLAAMLCQQHHALRLPAEAAAHGDTCMLFPVRSAVELGVLVQVAMLRVCACSPKYTDTALLLAAVAYVPCYAVLQSSGKSQPLLTSRVLHPCIWLAC